MTILVTGGAGFIGSNFALDSLAPSEESIVNLDALTYPGNLRDLDALKGDARHFVMLGGIGERSVVDHLLAENQPPAVANAAAEDLVDRSSRGRAEFMRTNVMGTFTLLEAVRGRWTKLDDVAPAQLSASTTSTPTWTAARSPPAHRPSPKPTLTSPTAHTRRVRPPATMGCEPGITPAGCRC